MRLSPLHSSVWPPLLPSEGSSQTPKSCSKSQTPGAGSRTLHGRASRQLVKTVQISGMAQAWVEHATGNCVRASRQLVTTVQHVGMVQASVEHAIGNCVRQSLSQLEPHMLKWIGCAHNEASRSHAPPSAKVVSNSLNSRRLEGSRPSAPSRTKRLCLPAARDLLVHASPKSRRQQAAGLQDVHPHAAHLLQVTPTYTCAPSPAPSEQPGGCRAACCRTAVASNG